MTPVSTRITIDPAVCHGKPCIRGMRYPVETVLEWPRMLWLIATGNADSRKLESMIRAALPMAQQAFETSSFIELGPDRLTVRE